MRPPLRALAAAGLGVCAAVLVACGDTNGLLGSGDASRLSNQLDAVSAAVDAGDCALAHQRAISLQIAVEKLPATVDAKLRADLRQGASTVAAQARNACSQAQTETVPTETTTTETQTQTTPTTGTTPTTSTTPTSTTPTTTTPTSPTTTPTTPGGGTGGAAPGAGGTGGASKPPKGGGSGGAGAGQ